MKFENRCLYKRYYLLIFWYQSRRWHYIRAGKLQVNEKTRKDKENRTLDTSVKNQVKLSINGVDINE